MIKFYVKRIISGKMLWNEVPNLWNDEVQAALKADGYTLNSDGTVSK